MLTMGVAVFLLRPSARPDLVPSATSVSLAPSNSAGSGSVSPTPPPATRAPNPSIRSRSETPVVVVEEGARAWGRFAADGDLEVVRPWFDPAGPQFEQFRKEALSGGVGGESYSVIVERPEVGLEGDAATVAAEVTFVRTGEPSQAFDWVFRLVREGGEWLIWTVSPAEP